MRLAVAVVLLALGGSSSAHTLKENTARVTLRDDHLDVSAELDLFLLLERSPTALAIASDAELAAEATHVQQVLEHQTQLAVDGAPLPLRVLGLPSGPELRGLAATLSASGHDHGELVRLRFESPTAVPGAHSVTLTLPLALGPVLVSFVQPAMRYTPAGALAAFEVLERAPIHRSATRWQSIGGVVVLVAAMAAVGWFTSRRRVVPS